jgi:glycosyltransferase involved in cell wall biosynthesis
MKILQLCHKVPYPPKDGGCIAINNLTQGLINQGCEVKVLALNTKKHFIDIDKLPIEYRSKTNIEAVFIDTEIKITSAIANLFSNKSYNIERFYSKVFADKLIEVLKSEIFDIVQLESLYVSMYVDIIRKYSKAKIIFRAHNIEHKIWEDNAQLAANPIKKAYINLLAKRLKKYELNCLNTFDSIITITKEDEMFFKNIGFPKTILTIPFGIDLKNNRENNLLATDFYSVFHIGAMDWQPNIDGINWFLNAVWKMVLVKHSQLKLYLAGRNMSNELKQRKISNVIVVGEVESATEFIQSKGLMIVPLLSGGGMRVKIIEGMALGKTIISTKIGAEGIDYENNKNILIADTADEFVEAISKCLNDKSFAESIGNDARLLVETKYDNQNICKKLFDFYQTIIKE